MVRIHLIRLLLQKCTKNGTYFIKSRRRKPVLAGFELLSMSCFSSNLVEVNRFWRGLNYFQSVGTFNSKLKQDGTG